MKNKKTKILFIIPSLGIGGAEVFCTNLVHEFSMCDEYDVHLLVFFDIISEKFKTQLNGKVTLYTLNKKPGFSFSFLKRLKKLIKDINPDIINSHSSRSFRYLLLIPFLKKIPIVHTITNDPKLHEKLPYVLFKIRMHQKSWNNLTFVGISNLVSDNLASTYNYPRNKIITIYNGLYELKAPDIIEKKYDFFNCANLTWVKRHDVLLIALSKMKHNAKLAIAGSGPERERLIELSETLKLKNRVSFLGSVIDPSALYFSSRCFILTSSSEGNPICINEAMSAGIPIIATRVGGIPDLITDGINGFLFDVNATPDEIAMKMDSVLALNESELNFIEQNNKEKVKQWYMEEIFKQYKELFDSKKRQLPLPKKVTK